MLLLRLGMYTHIPQLIVAWLAIVLLAVACMALVWAYAPRVDPSAIVSAWDGVTPQARLREVEGASYTLTQIQLVGVRYGRALHAWERETAKRIGVSVYVLNTIRARGVVLGRDARGRMVSLRYQGAQS